MTTERFAPHGAESETVTALHEQWVQTLGRMTSGGLNRPSRTAGYELRRLASAATDLEARIAETPARTIAEVRLKLRMAGSRGTLTKCPALLVDSAACDLKGLDPSFRLSG